MLNSASNPGIERLRSVYAMVGGLPSPRVNLANWRSAASKQALLREKHACGTTACGVGWACIYPELTAQGLQWHDNAPRYRGEVAWEAVQKFFGLTEFQAFAIFQGPDAIYGADSKHIQAFVDSQYRGEAAWHVTRTIGHKRTLLMRIRNYLRTVDAISEERWAELQAWEGTL